MAHNTYSPTRSHPFLFYGIIFFGLTLAVTIALVWLFHWDVVIAWLVAISPVTLLAYRVDKGIASSDHTRVPERILLLLALLGGTPGAILGMWFIGEHHKTSKRSFMLPFIGILVVQVILVGAYLSLRSPSR